VLGTLWARQEPGNANTLHTRRDRVGKRARFWQLGVIMFASKRANMRSAHGPDKCLIVRLDRRWALVDIERVGLTLRGSAIKVS